MTSSETSVQAALGEKKLTRSRPSALSSPERRGDRERLLQFAERLAVETKLGKAFTTNALAKSGIMAVGSIHNKFGTREQLIAILLKRQAARLTSKLPPFTSFDRVQVLRSHADAVLTVIGSDPLLFTVLDAEERKGRQSGLSGMRATLERSLLAALSQPGAPRWSSIDVIAAQLAGIMLVMASESLHLSIERMVASRAIQQVAIRLVDECRWT